MVMVQYIDICSPICKLNFEDNKTNVRPQAAPEKTDTMFKRKPSETQCPCLDWGLVCSRRVFTYRIQPLPCILCKILDPD